MTKNNIEIIKDILIRNYGIKNPILSEAPRGFVAETYVVQSGDKKYFAKIVRISRYSDNLISSLPVLFELHKFGITNISYPIVTTNGELTSNFDGKVLVLFDFIDGECTFEYNFENYSKLIGLIHAKTDEVKLEIKKDDFNLPFIFELKNEIKQILKANYQSGVEKELKDLIVEHDTEIFEDIAKIEALSNSLRKQNFRYVMTHGDAPGNIMQGDDGNIYLIDWDDLLLAPAERDTWFHVHTDKEKEFLKNYHLFNPDYNFNLEAYAFYVYRRYLDDLEGFVSKVLEVGATNEQKNRSLEQLKNDCFDWLRPRVQELNQVKK